VLSGYKVRLPGRIQYTRDPLRPGLRLLSHQSRQRLVLDRLIFVLYEVLAYQASDGLTKEVL